jgi:MFS family permease
VAGRGEALRRCWANPKLRRVLAAYLLFIIAEWASWIALLVWAYNSHGVFGSSAVAVVQLIPAIALAPVAAARLGRWPGPRALRVGYAAQSLASAALGIAVLAGAPFALACVLAAVQASSFTLTRPVHHSLLPEISHTTSELTAGNAGSGWVEAIAALVGPLVSGVLVVWWGPGGALTAMAVVAALALGCTVGLGEGVPRVRFVTDDDKPLAELHAVLRDPAGRMLSGLVAAEYVLVGTVDILLVVLALDVLGMSQAGPGLLNSAIGVGGLVGASASIVLIGAKRLAPALLVGALAAGLPFALIWLVNAPWAAMVLIAVYGAGGLFFGVATRTFVQRILPDRLLTAFFGLQESTMSAGLAIGSIVAPLLVAGPGPQVAFLVAGLFLPLVALAAWRALRRLDAATTVPADRLALLRGVPMLAVLAPRVVERLAVFSGHESRPDATTVVTEGQEGNLFYIVESGHVDVRHGTDHIRRLGPGDWFGELALLRADERRTATVTADGPVSLVTVDRHTFLTALAGVPKSLDIADDYARDHYR